MTRDFELTLMFDSQLAQDAVEETVKRYTSLLEGGGARDLAIDRKGVRKLAYAVKKRQQCNYVFIQFSVETAAVAELERQCRLDQGLLRHLLVRLDDGLTPVAAPAQPAAPAAPAAEGDVAGKDEAQVQEVKA